MQLDHTINGRAVRFRERIPFKDGRRLPGLLAGCKDEDLGTFVPIFQLVIESWGFEGDPAAAESYDGLDTFTEAMPLMSAAGEYVNARAAAAANTKA